MKKNTNTIIAIATAAVLPFFAFNAAAEDSAVTHAQAQQIRIAAISVEDNLEAMRLEMNEEQNVEITAMTQLNEEQIDLEVERDLENNEEYQELIAD
ncbi:hypothetical protein RI845_11860 [Thalassotalea nanhaiensis]|uniref:Uncharacterized protein n=1 Tax=Thalassotalea nanhaiensis TaxID=3065648 RepID=A0ABY9TEK6_9GAMM|nr:hypothetical protein RI845_11860 [Colwelliaceae bacterium SQ345]